MGTTSKMSSVLISIGWIRWKMSLIWSDNWERWQLSNICPDGYIFSKETGDKHMTTNCLHVKTSVSIRHLWALTYSCIFTHGFNYIEMGKKIHACGHDFEDVISAYLNWKNLMKDVTDLIGQLKRWQLSNIRPDMIFNPIIIVFVTQYLVWQA